MHIVIINHISYLQIQVGDPVGRNDGVPVGLLDGFLDGCEVGAVVGAVVGIIDGVGDGISEGNSDGLNVGSSEGASLGTFVGSTVGDNDGVTVGISDGVAVGSVVGLGDGKSEGMKLGASVGQVPQLIRQFWAASMNVLHLNFMTPGPCRVTQSHRRVSFSPSEGIGKRSGLSWHDVGAADTVGDSVGARVGAFVGDFVPFPPLPLKIPRINETNERKEIDYLRLRMFQTVHIS